MMFSGKLVVLTTWHGDQTACQLFDMRHLLGTVWETSYGSYIYLCYTFDLPMVT